MKFYQSQKTKDQVTYVALLAATSATIVMTTEALWFIGDKLIKKFTK